MDGLLALCQALHFGAAMLLFGMLVFLSVLAPHRIAHQLEPALRRLELACLGVLLVTAIVWPAVVAIEIDDGDGFGQNLVTLLLDTAFGHVWLARLALIAGLAAAIGWRLPLRWRALAAAGVLATLSLVGHAIEPQGPLGHLHEASQALHLLSSGAWIGGLVPLVYLLRLQPNAEASLALRRFSAWGHGFVAVVIATGVLNTVLIRKIWPPDLGSPYVEILLAKLAVVTLMVGVALINRYGIVPRLREHPSSGPRLLRRFSLANVMLGGLAIALASLLGSLDPT